MQNSGPTERTVAFSRLKLANKCVCGRGFAPDPAGGACSAPPDPLAGLRGPTFKGKGTGAEWEGEGRGKGGEGEEREERRENKEGKGRGGKGKVAPPFLKFLDPPL